MPQFAYYQKKFMPLSEARLNLMTNFMHYGTGAFEGIRGNWNEERKQIYLFRLKEHYERLFASGKMLKIDLPYTTDELCKITVELVKQSDLKENIYIRPVAYKSSETMGVRLHNLESDFFAFVMPWGRYLDTDKCRVGVSSWRRPGGNFASPQSKICGGYVNSAFAKTEAHDNGYDEAILLNEYGRVSEGSGENIFLVINGKLVTPGIYENILVGITRNTIIELAKDELGIETEERPIERTELYTSQEAFFTGTAAHVAPIAEIDHRLVGDGEIGPISKKLQALYYDVIEGRNPKYMQWCTPVY
ncbi:MAG: branched-chain amino acid transaminase [Dehalococcoidales bacterium]|nr:branched-chain amino acid transaminase [Dehalococcoidales bacterium]